MKVRFLGARALDFKGSDESPVKGIQLFIAYPEENVVGEMAEKLFIRDGFALPECKPGDMLEVAYNHKGKPESIKLMAKQA